MPRIERSTPLDSGDVMPQFSFETVGGPKTTVPAPGTWSVFLIYRGEW